MTIKKITAEKLNQKLNAREKIMILDVRDEAKYNSFHIAVANVASKNIHKSEIFKLAEGDHEISSLPKDQEIIVTCTTGNSATKCAEILKEKSYQVTVLKGGVTAWKEYVEPKS